MGWAGNDKYTPAQSSHSTINQRKHSNVASMCLLANGSATDKFTPLCHYPPASVAELEGWKGLRECRTGAMNVHRAHCRKSIPA